MVDFVSSVTLNIAWNSINQSINALVLYTPTDRKERIVGRLFIISHHHSCRLDRPRPSVSHCVKICVPVDLRSTSAAY